MTRADVDPMLPDRPVATTAQRSFVKLFMDGVIDSRTRYRLQDYPGVPGHKSNPCVMPHVLPMCRAVAGQGARLAFASDWLVRMCRCCTGNIETIAAEGIAGLGITLTILGGKITFGG
jgi:hypothetical protein